MQKLVFVFLIAILNEKLCHLTRIENLKKKNLINSDHSLLISNNLQIEPRFGKFKMNNQQNLKIIYNHIKIYRMNNLRIHF